MKERKKEIVVWYGRANPMTSSHLIGFHTVLSTAAEKKCPYTIYLTSSYTKDTEGITPSSKMNNPMSPRKKLQWAKKAMPKKTTIVLATVKNKTNTLYAMIQTLSNQFETIHIVAGPDRVETILEVKKRYAEVCTVNHILSHGRLVVDNDSGKVIDVRGTNLREAIYKLDFETAKSYMPHTFKEKEKWAYFYDVLVQSGRLKGYDEYMTQQVL
jgi:hypothetical protein